MEQPTEIAKLVLPISLGFGGLGLYTLLPWRGGNTGWIGVGLLCCCVAGVSVHLANPGEDFEPPGASPVIIYGIGALGLAAVAGAVCSVVSPSARSLLAGFGGVVVTSSLLVGAIGGLEIGAACLVVNSMVAARLWQRVKHASSAHEGVVRSSEKRSEDFAAARETPLVIAAVTALAGAVLLWGLPSLDSSTIDAPSPTPGRHGYLLVAGMLLIVVLAFIGSLSPDEGRPDEPPEGGLG